MDLCATLTTAQGSSNMGCGGVEATVRTTGHSHTQMLARILSLSSIEPPPEFIPPNDQAADVLLLNRGMRTTGDKIRFDRVDMDHSLPGCGNLVRPFGNKKLILTQGDFVRPGYQYVLDWN